MAAEKHYQIFVSSTFRDLREERQAIQRSILELGHMPAGMELFPATDDSAWELIKGVIDESDYYVLVVGGMYGSLHPDGLSFTEMEYDYAYEHNKPVVALLHKSPEGIARGKTEIEPEKWQLLEKFRSKVSSRHTCQFWDTVHDLKSNLIVSLTATIKRKPAVGWVRADTVPSQARIEEMLMLQSKVAELEAQLSATATSPAPGSSDLSQGDDEHTVVGSQIENDSYVWRDYTFFVTWDEIFGLVGPKLFNECTDEQLRRALLDALNSTLVDVWREDPDIDQEERNRGRIRGSVPFSAVDTFIVQFRALGLITESQRKRSVTDTSKYWALTAYGDHRLNQLRAIRKPS